MGVEGQKKNIFSVIFSEHIEWIILFEFLAYEKTIFLQNFVKFL